MKASKFLVALLLLLSVLYDAVLSNILSNIDFSKCRPGYTKLHSREYCSNLKEVMEIIDVTEENIIFKRLGSKIKIDDLGELQQFINDPYQDLDLTWLSKCVKMIAGKLNAAKYKEIISIFRNVWDKEYSNFQALNFLQILENFLANIVSSASITDPKYYLALWYPFQNNVTGFVLNENSSSYTVGEIYNNQSFEDIDVNGAKMAAYVPHKFLLDLTQNLTQNEKNKLRIVMLFLVDDDKLADILRPDENIKQFVGITIPGFCKRNSLSVLYLFSAPTMENPRGTWADFGSKYFDSDLDDCTLNKVSFFGRANEQFYEHQRKLFCLKKQLESHSLLKDVSITESGKVFPEHFCMDENFRIPQTYCASAEHGKEYSYNFGCFNSHSTSQNTQTLYSTYIKCLVNVKDCKTEVEETDLITFVDVYIYMQILVTKKGFDMNRISDLLKKGFDMNRISDLLEKGFDRNRISDLLKKSFGMNQISDLLEKSFDMNQISDLLEKSLSLIQEQSKHTRQMNYICEFLKLLTFKEKKIHLTPKFAYFNIIANDTDEGFTLKRKNANSTIERITDEKMNVDEPAADEIDVVVLIPNRTKAQYECNIDFFVIYDSDYSEHDNYTCQSRILGVQHECHKVRDTLKLKIYFKIVDDKKMWYTRGYWTEVEVLPRYFALICIAEPVDNICDSGSIPYVYQKYKREFRQDVIIRRNKIQIDILSQLAVSMNPRSQELYQLHYKVLEVIMLTGSSFSILGIFCMILCAIFIKDWYKPRLYSIQLSLSYVLEIAFFLPSVQSYTHLHYLIFYYGILAQFTWMLLIGHVQYMKFVKVFRPSQLSAVKSLLIGWLTPAAIMGLSILVHRDCLKCDLCYKNSYIFAYFVVIPISLIILCNMIIYVLIMFKISNTKFAMTAKVTKAKLRATIMFPFLFGISWICIFAVISPWPLLSLIGSYLFHIIVTSQGFILFIFIVVLDRETIKELRNKLRLPLRHAKD